ncbi:K(+)-transporting ATPase subunit C [Taibaiella koreensis]|uniref:K(+)-transporting ATPase subunit C n=1 Tax=Taibaiella koreensis TaxID=1268548 RepID=UPI000E5A01A8|nr:K(+)-transporting ATPase subunit C [Taibaiella koreensis]
MKQFLWPSIKLTLLSLVLLSGLYTLILLGFARLTPGKGKGEMIEWKGKTYYANIGQSFTDDRYFWSRPSAVGYNAAGSGGSNKGPNNPEFLQTVKDRIDTFLVHNPGINRAQIPVDMVTASGSGLDPNISLQAARVQASRIARLRGIPEASLVALIDKQTEKPLLGLFGPAKLNVLRLNIALDDLK